MIVKKKGVAIPARQQNLENSVFRSLIFASFAFVWGSPQFADLRPEALDVPLVNFHHEVKGVADDAVYAVQSVQVVRELRFMDGYFSVIGERLGG